MEEDLKISLLEKGWLIIITLEGSREDVVVSVYISLSRFSLLDDETFYFMKRREGNICNAFKLIHTKIL